jgi:hypothetical protein
MWLAYNIKNKIHIFSGYDSGKYTGTGLQVCHACFVSQIINLKN